MSETGTGGLPTTVYVGDYLHETPRALVVSGPFRQRLKSALAAMSYWRDPSA